MTHQAYEAQQPVVWDADYVVIGTGAGAQPLHRSLAAPRSSWWKPAHGARATTHRACTEASVIFDHWGTTVTRPSHLANHPGSLREGRP